jgi:hypothetical protein
LSQGAASGAAPKTLAVVGAHPDDEGPVAPILARYAREGAQVYLIIASDCRPALKAVLTHLRCSPSETVTNREIVLEG